MKKIVAAIFTVMVLLGCVQGLNFHADAAIDVAGKINDLRDVYVDGEYFCYLNSSDCSKSGTKHCSHSWSSSCSNCGAYIYSGTEKAWQCYGFACRMGYVVFGKDPFSTWTKLYSVSSLKAGDIVRYRPSSTATYNHAIFIISVSGSTVKYADCNATGSYACQIQWDASTTTSTIATNISRKLYGKDEYGFIWRAPNYPATSYDLECYGNYSLCNYMLGTDFSSSLNSSYIYSRDTSVYNLSIDSVNTFAGSNTLKIVGSSAGSSGSDLSFKTDTNPDTTDNGYVGDNKSMTLSFYAKSSIAGAKMYWRFGYGDYYSPITLTTSWAKYSIKFTKLITDGNVFHPYIDKACTVNLSQLMLVDGSTSASADTAETAGMLSTITATYGGTYGTLSSPTRSGYTFNGWFTSKIGGTQITSSTSVKAGSMRVYAHWTKINTYAAIKSVDYGGHRYAVYNDDCSWDTAKAKCTSLGGNLVVIGSAGENSAVTSLITNAGKCAYWIGYSDTDLNGTWSWVTGEANSYTNWMSGEPSGDEYYVSMLSKYYGSYGTIGQWNDSNGATTPISFWSTYNTGFVCEYGVSSISVKTNPTKTTYFIGDTLSTSGLTLNANYPYGSAATISSGFTCSPTTLSTAGTQTITVSYGGKTTTFNVTVVPITVSSISAKTNPTKTSYYVGDTLNTSGLTLTATYNNGTTATVSSGFTCSPTTLPTVGTQIITVTYPPSTNITTTFSVTVTTAPLNGITVKTNPTKTSYFVGDTLNTSGLTLTATYNNGTMATITSGFTCSPTTLTAAGNQTITVTYGGKTTTFVVTVTPITVESIAVKTNPTKTTYNVGEALDTTGLTLTATYNNGTTATITSGFTCSPTTLSTAGNQTITVTYGGKTTTFVVTVTPITVESIVVKTNPTKTSYFVGDTLDTAGLTLTASYSNSTTGTISSGFTCSPTVMSTEGTQTITVTYGGQPATFTVTVQKRNEASLNAIEIASAPSKIRYYVGDTLDETGLSLKLHYSDSSSYVLNAGFTCSPTTFSNTGVQTVTVTYSGKSVMFNVFVTGVNDNGFNIFVQDNNAVLNDTEMKLNLKDKTALTAKFYNVSDGFTIIWTTDTPTVVSVDENGNITATGRGTAVITATIKGTDISAQFTVNVGYSVIQWILVIFLFGWIWLR